MKNNNSIKILDKVIEDKNRINIAQVQRETGLSYPYVWQLLNGARNNQESLLLVRNAVVKLYGSLVRDHKTATAA